MKPNGTMQRHQYSELQGNNPAFRLMIATSWLAPDAWQQKQEAAIREAVYAGPDWVEYRRLLIRHRTAAVSWSALKRAPGLEIPEPVAQELQSRSESWEMQAVKQSMRLIRVLKAFNRAGIPVMPMKGPTLSAEVHGDLRLRQFNDLDLAVKPEDLPKAQTCLEKLGWRLDSIWSPLTPRQWQSVLRHEYHLSFTHRDGGTILELHWRSTWDTPALIEARWARSTLFVWQESQFQAMSPIDQVIYLCSHGGRHAWYRAHWLSDLARIHAEGRLDWEATLAEAQATGQERPLLACLRIVQELYGLPIPKLTGNPWKGLPSLLVNYPISALRDDQFLDPEAASALALLRDRFRLNYYYWQLLPGMPWLERMPELIYSRDNFKVLHLSDNFFWLYTLLHPFLWVWRRTRRGALKATTQKIK